MAEIRRGASAVWKGSIREGGGRASVDSGLFQDAPVTYSSRFEQGEGTNPEELVAAAHAACFSMALSGILTRAGKPPDEIRTRATVSLRAGQGEPKVVGVHLDVAARVPGMDQQAFAEAAQEAKRGCPISRLLAPGLEWLTMDACLTT
jgi:osmotically inducible protein OsmC